MSDLDLVRRHRIALADHADRLRVKTGRDPEFADADARRLAAVDFAVRLMLAIERSDVTREVKP